MKYFKLKFLLLFAALAVAIPSAWAETVTDVITLQGLGISGTSYQSFSDKTFSSNAVYKGIVAGGKSSIQMNTSKISGIVTTASGGKVKSVTVTFNSGNDKSVKVFGKNTAYSEANDVTDQSLYGTLLYTIANFYSGTTYTIDGDYDYIAFGPNSGAVYIDKIEIVWETEGGDTPPTPTVAAPVFDPVTETTFENTLDVTLTCATQGATIKYGYNEDYQEIDYIEPISIDETTTLYAKAVLGEVESEVVSATYTKEEPVVPPTPSDKVYKKVYSTDDVKDGTYLIVYEDGNLAFNGALETLDAVGNSVAVTITEDRGDKIIAGTEIIDAVTFTYDATAKTLKSASGYYIGQTSDANGLASDQETTYKNAISITEGYDADIVSSNAHLRYNSASNQIRFRYFKSGSYTGQKAIQLYKLVEEEPVLPLGLELDPAEGNYTVGDNVTVYATVENGSESTMVTYKINDGEEQDYTEAGIILPNTAAGDVVVTVYALDGDNEATATATYHFDAAEAFAITLTPDGSEDYTVGDKVNVKVGVENNIANCTITYSIDRAVETYDPEKGIDIPNDKAGDVTLTVNVTDGFDHQGASSTTATYHFNAAPAIEVTLTPAGGNYFLDEQVTVTVTTENTIGDAMITYQIGDGEEQLYEDGITITAQEAGTVNLTVTVADGYHEGVATATGEYIFTERPVAAAPEFSLVSGSYGTAQSLEITSADGATIYYTTDGTEPTTASTQYTSAIELGEGETIIKAIAVKEGMTNSAVANAYYIIDIPEVLPTITAFKGYYQIKNNGNSKYANIAGRKTMNFTGAPESAPGTVIWLETNDKGQVQSLRSQGADLQGYAERAMRYVPTMVKLVVDKLHAEGAGEILGENGYDEIMAKFDSCFDYHLYVEQVGGSWRIYGKTPSMQPVVDFYREHTHQVETKLPDLEGFINKVLKKLRDRIGGESIFTDFSVRQIWENMNVTLTEPVDSASTMTFYREVLNNKNYVWDFAYQTAQIYWNNVKHHPRYDELIRGNLGEYADYLDEFVNQIHPDFKYYIIQRGDEPDYISEGNKEIRDGEAHTLWTIEDRPDFTVNIAGDQFGCPYGGGIGGYATTLYTDFAYTLPNEVTAYKVTAVKNGVATLAALSGIIPAQTPVLLIADAQGDYTLTLSTTAGTKVTGNLLCGVDSLITRFQLKTPMLVTLFNAVQGFVGDDLYNEYVQPYEYLQLLYAGTVNNKYFWGLTQSDANLCVYMGDDDMEHCVFRNLDGGAFVDNGVAPKANKAFLVSEKDAAIRIASKGDVNHDGKIDIADVTTLISRVLKGSGSACEYCGDMDSDGSLTIADVTTLINLCLRQSIVLVPDNEGN